MTEEVKQLLDEWVEEDGFDYAFRDGTSFTEIKDPKFHQLRIAYIEAADRLENYVGL